MTDVFYNFQIAFTIAMGPIFGLIFGIGLGYGVLRGIQSLWPRPARRVRIVRKGVLDE